MLLVLKIKMDLVQVLWKHDTKKRQRGSTRTRQSPSRMKVGLTE